MRNRSAALRRCSYVVVVESSAAAEHGLRELAGYLSTLGVAGCDVVILDPSPRPQFDRNGRILRWVGRHVAVRSEYRTPGGAIDLVRCAASLAACEKVIVAADDVRYSADAIAEVCDLLDFHEVVEPQDYVDPLPWWGGIEAGRILIHRGIEPQPDHGATFAFRRDIPGDLHSLAAGDVIEDHVRRLGAAGAQVFVAARVFVRREPGPLDGWASQRARAASDDFALPVKTAFFFSITPLLVLLALAGSLALAASTAGAIAFASVGLAIRGRAGAGAFFPLHACLFAPLWVFERSVSVYWALFRKLRGTDEDARRVMEPDSAGHVKVASGE
jgi:hypothetical protein